MGPILFVGVGVAEGAGEGLLDGEGDFDGDMVEHSHTPVPVDPRERAAGHVKH